MWSDASDVGWGGEVAGVRENVVIQPAGPVGDMTYGVLPRDEIRKSSTRRELVALLMLAKTPAILEQIRGRRVKIILDSIPALRNLIKGGGPVKELCDAVRLWTEFCERNRIEPVYEWWNEKETGVPTRRRSSRRQVTNGSRHA